MKPESKGRFWCNEILHKFETILVEVDNFASQCHKNSLTSSDPRLNSVRDEAVVLPEENHHSPDNFVTHQCRRPLVLGRRESSSCLPNWKYNALEKVRCKEQNKGCNFREKLDLALTYGKKLSCASSRKEQSDCNQTAAASSPRCNEPLSYQRINKVSSQETQVTHCSPIRDKTGDSNLIPLASEIPPAPVEDKVLANSSSSGSDCMSGNEDDFRIGEVDAAPLDTTDLCDVVVPEVDEDDINSEKVDAAPLDTIDSCDVVVPEVDEDDINSEEVDAAPLDTTDLCDVVVPEVDEDDINSDVVDAAPMDTIDLCDVVPEVDEDDINSEEVDAAPMDTIDLCDVVPDVDEDDINSEEVDAAPLDTVDLCDVAFPEDSSDFDDKLIYTAHDRTKQLRSLKNKIMDALTSQRRREKEYEQLPIWFGDAKMGCDLSTKERAKSQDSESSQSHVPLESDESEWELL